MVMAVTCTAQEPIEDHSCSVGAAGIFATPAGADRQNFNHGGWGSQGADSPSLVRRSRTARQMVSHWQLSIRQVRSEEIRARRGDTARAPDRGFRFAVRVRFPSLHAQNRSISLDGLMLPRLGMIFLADSINRLAELGCYRS
jgi:hypothetical protein